MNIQEIESSAVVSLLPVCNGEPEEWIAELPGFCGHGASPCGAVANLVSQIKLA